MWGHYRLTPATSLILLAPNSCRQLPACVRFQRWRLEKDRCIAKISKDHGIQHLTTLWPELTWICWLDSHGIGCLLVLWKNADSAWPAEAWILQLGRAFWNPWPSWFLLASPPSWGHSFISGCNHAIFIYYVSWSNGWFYNILYAYHHEQGIVMANRRIQITVAWPWPPCVDHGTTWLSMAQQVAGKPMGVPSISVQWKILGMDQYLWIPFLGGWTSIYQLFWCSPGVQGFDTLPYWTVDLIAWPIVVFQLSEVLRLAASQLWGNGGDFGDKAVQLEPYTDPAMESTLNPICFEKLAAMKRGKY